MKSDYLTTINGRFYYVRKVPADIRQRVGRSLWRTSLKTRDRAEAERKARRLAADHDDAIDRYRSLTPKRVEAIGAELTRLGLKVTGGDGKWDLGAVESALELVRSRLAQAQEVGGLRLLALAETVGVDDALDLTFNGRRFEQLREEQLPALFTESRLEAVRSELVGEAATPTSAPPEGNGLGSVYTLWIKRANPSPLSAGEAEVAMRRFIDVNGNLPLAQITKEHVRKLRAVLERLPKRIPDQRRKLPLAKVAELTPQDGSVPLLAAASVRKQIGFVRTLLGVAENDGLIDTNPAAGIRIVDDRDEKARLPFDESHLRSMFGAIPDDPTFYWMTILAYTTGARMSELATLDRANVRTEAGITFLDILDGKTVNARRRIPLHPLLTDLGFHDYVETRSGPLTDHEPDSKKRLAGYFQKRFGRWLRSEAKVDDARRTFHSFRHLFRDLALSAGVDEVLIERLQGWAPATTGRGYGSGASLERLAEAVATIRFPVVPPRRQAR